MELVVENSTLRGIIKDKLELINKDLLELIEVIDSAIRDVEENIQRVSGVEKEELISVAEDLEDEKIDLQQSEGRIKRIIERLIGKTTALDLKSLMKVSWFDMEKRIQR